MAKIMLVEDDNNLREIYEARLLAEGYEIISAKDGEEALAIAVKEKPDLIISDVMMPKISGFDMLDILRSTPETKDTKVIMMTALSQAEDKARAEKLGADRYLVKSQVTLEDVAQVTREVLEGKAPAPASTPASAAASAEPITNPATSPAPTTVTPTTTNVPVTVAPEPTNTPSSVAEPTQIVAPVPAASDPAGSTSSPTPPASPSTSGAQTSSQENQEVEQQINNFVQQPTNVPSSDKDTVNNADATNAASVKADQLAGVVNDLMDQKASQTDASANPDLEPSQKSSDTASSEASKPRISTHGKVLQPVNDLSSPAKGNLDDLLKKEEAKEAAAAAVANPPADTVITPPASAGTTSSTNSTADTTKTATEPPKDDPNAIAL